ncbi:hypothetical protein M404DRAFT_823092 [Pisolithus tinctorius Marx 270]|uniref:Uncharacterized protein n=1 Tax=Pisolithus tinctorius Marx 270 TaxID=870435 RepID=A0A0C3IQ08_PISTI|nr:hypothetical protein M404DRAFT_823092 [Pisolithus tinctorius Marx 270]
MVPDVLLVYLFTFVGLAVKLKLDVLKISRLNIRFNNQPLGSTVPIGSIYNQ